MTIATDRNVEQFVPSTLLWKCTPNDQYVHVLHELCISNFRTVQGPEQPMQEADVTHGSCLVVSNPLC